MQIREIKQIRELAKPVFCSVIKYRKSTELYCVYYITNIKCLLFNTQI